MQLKLKEQQVNSLLATLSLSFASVVAILLCVILVSGNDFKFMPYKEYYDAIMVICYFLSWVISIFAVYFIVKYKKQNEIYLPFGVFGFIGVIVALRLKDKDKAKHDKQILDLNKDFGARTPVSSDRGPSNFDMPPTPSAPPPPKEEFINAKSIRIVTTDGKVYNINTGDGSGQSGAGSDGGSSSTSEPAPRPRPASVESSGGSSMAPPPPSKPLAIPPKPTMLGNLTKKVTRFLPKMPKLPKIPFPKMGGKLKMNSWGTWFRVPKLRLKPLSKQNYLEDEVFTLDPKSRLQKGHYIRRTKAQNNLGHTHNEFRAMKKQENIWGPDTDTQE